MNYISGAAGRQCRRKGLSCLAICLNLRFVKCLLFLLLIREVDMRAEANNPSIKTTRKRNPPPPTHTPPVEAARPNMDG